MRTLGPYQLLRKIGTGGMAEVWSARRAAADVAGQKFVAIKILAPHLAENPRYRKMFVDEARLSLVLNHANIVTIFDVVQNESECYMVMELVEGMTLSQLERGLGKRGEKIPREVAVYVVAELLRALAYAHELKTDMGSTIVHRDVSPQNVMVSTSGEVKLMDFGIARFSTEETNSNIVKGKLQYMPPEQLAKRTREPTIDLFAVGGILHELLEGRRFRGGVDQEVLLGMVIRGETPELTVDIPAGLDMIREMLLDPDPSSRMPSAKEALAMLYAWPDYRNASIQLEELVCEFVAPASSTSMPHVFEDETPVSEVSAELLDSALLGSSLIEDEELEGTDAGKGQANVDTTPGANGIGSQPGLEVTNAEIAMLGRRPIAASPKRAAAVVGALLLFALVIGVWQPWATPSEDTPASDEVAVAKPEPKPVPVPVEVTTAGEAAGEAASERTLDAPLAAEAPDEAAAEDEDEDVDEAASSSSKANTAKVSVEFVAHDFYFVYIKVGGRTLTLEPKAQIKLPVGSHSVYLRQKSSESWKRAGTLRLSRGGRYRVEMTKPAGLKQSKK